MWPQAKYFYLLLKNPTVIASKIQLCCYHQQQITWTKGQWVPYDCVVATGEIRNPR